MRFKLWFRSPVYPVLLYIEWKEVMTQRPSNSASLHLRTLNFEHDAIFSNSLTLRYWHTIMRLQEGSPSSPPKPFFPLRFLVCAFFELSVCEIINEPSVFASFSAFNSEIVLFSRLTCYVYVAPSSMKFFSATYSDSFYLFWSIFKFDDFPCIYFEF